MPTARSYLTAAVVNDKIYAIGGDEPLTSTVEEYDPSTNTWSAKTSMSSRKERLTSTVVKGKIYVIGGLGGRATNSVEEYDPSIDTWSEKASMNEYRYALTSATVNDKIYAIGGENYYVSYSIFYSKVEMYDPATNIWTSKSDMPTKRSYLGSYVVNDKIYAIGGQSYIEGYIVTVPIVEEFSPIIYSDWAIFNPFPILNSSGWYLDFELNPDDYSWAMIDQDSSNLSIRLFIQPLDGADTSNWDFRYIRNFDELSTRLGSEGLNLTEGTDYQLLVRAEDVVETVFIELNDLSTLLPATGQTGANWFLDAIDYTWTTVDPSSTTLTVRLLVQPLGGVDTSNWDFSGTSTVSDLSAQLGNDGLNLVEGTDYQLLVVGQDDKGRTDGTSDDVSETLSVQLTDLSTLADQPLPQWVANISLDPTDYTWSQLQADSPNLTLRLLVRPLEGTDATGWDFRAITTLTALSNLLGAGVLNLQQGSHYQLQLLAQDDNGTAEDTSDDVSETLSLQWGDLMPPQLLLVSSQVDFGLVRVANLTLTDVHGQQWQLSTPANSRSLSLHNAGGGQLSITQIEKSSPLATILSITAADDSVLVYPLQIAAGSSRQVKLVLSPSSPVQKP